MEGSEIDRAEAIRQMRNASLQLAASILIDQTTQSSKAEHDLYEGVRLLEEIKAARRRLNVPSQLRCAKGSTSAPRPC